MEFSLDFDRGNDETCDGIGGHVLFKGESILRPLLLPEAPEKKLCSLASGLCP